VVTLARLARAVEQRPQLPTHLGGDLGGHLGGDLGRGGRWRKTNVL
jgi:hypothetical protein